MSPLLDIYPVMGVYSIGYSLRDPLASESTMRRAIAMRPVVDPQDEGRRLMIWLGGYCRSGHWTVGPDCDAPSRKTFGRVGFVVDTLHEAIVVKRALSYIDGWGMDLTIWLRGSVRRLSTRVIAQVLMAEALSEPTALEAALYR